MTTVTALTIVDRGSMPPIITRASVVGTERSRDLFDPAYREHSRRIARVIDRGSGHDAISARQEVTPTV
jgi:hypothetical protein